MIILASSSPFTLDQRDLPPGPSADSAFSIDIEPVAGSDSKFSVDQIGSGALGLSAPSGDQFAWLVFRHEEVDHLDSSFATSDPVTVTFAPDATTWAASTQGFAGDEVGGNEVLAWHGREVDFGRAAPGLDEIDISIDIQIDPDDDTSLTRYPLVPGAIAWDNTRTLIGHDPTRIGGGDYLSRFEHVKIDGFRKLAGVETTHGKIIKALLALTGIPPERIAISDSLGHTLTALYEPGTCFEGGAEAQRIAMTIAHRLMADFDGRIVARPMAPVELPPVAEINIEVLETGEVTASISAQSKGLPTAYRVEGQRPVDPDSIAGYIGERKLVSRTIEPYTTPPTFSQDIFGAVSQLRPAFTEDRVTNEIWVTETKFNGCLTQRITETWKQFNPEVYRYVTASPANPTGEPVLYRVTFGNGFIFGDAVTKDGTTPMRRNFNFELHPVLVHQVDFLYDGTDGLSGALLKATESTSTWGTIEETRKASTDPDKTWEQENVRATLLLFAGGRVVAELGGGNAEEVWFEGPVSPTFDLGGVAGMGAVFLGGNASLPGEPSSMRKVAKWGRQETTDVELVTVDKIGTSPRDLKYETGRDTDAEDYGIDQEGPAFEFRNGDVSNAPTHEGLLEQVVEEDYVNDGVATHQLTRITTTGKGVLISNETKPGQPSQLPRAEICNEETNALEETVAVIGRCEITGEDLIKRVETKSITFGMEDEGAASTAACRWLRADTALDVTLSLPISGVFHAWAPVIFRAKHKGIDPNDYIDGITKLSNAWVETAELKSATGRKTVVLTLKLATF